MNYSYNFRNLSRLKPLFLKSLCTKANSDYIPVYKFPFISQAATINKLKLYQSILTAISIPSSFVLNNFGILSHDTFAVTCALGLIGTLTLFTIGIVPHKLIGFIYVKNDNKTVKISYADFWGRRKDVEINSSDLVPISDLPVIPTDLLYLTLRQFSSKRTFKLNLKYAVILEKEKFNNVFLQNVQ